MSERTYELISSLPDAITPLAGDEYCEVEQGGVSRKVPYNVLGGVPNAHASSHKHGGSDEVGTADKTANAIPKTDGDGTLDVFISDGSTTTKGIVLLAADSESDETKVVASNDSRLSDSRTPTSHAASHMGGTDPISTLPTADEKAALAGSYGFPSDTNRYVTETDPLMLAAGAAIGELGINFYNGQFEDADDVSTYTVYNDGSNAYPTDGVGGIQPDLIFSRDEDGLVGDFSGSLIKSGNISCKGSGLSKDFTIDPALAGTDMQISFYHGKNQIVSYDYEDGYFSLFLYDVTNASLIPLSQSAIPFSNGPSKFVSTFTASTSSSYRLIWHITKTTTNDIGMLLDDIQITSRTITQGAAVGSIPGLPKANITNLPGSWNANKTKIYRRGNVAVIHAVYVASGPATGLLAISQSDLLPDGLTCSVAKKGWFVSAYMGTGVFTGIYGENSIFVPGTFNQWNTTTPTTWSSGSDIKFDLELPVDQWSDTIGLVQGYEEYASNSDVSATASVTGSGFLQGFGQFGGFGSGWATGTTWIRRVKFTQPIQWGRDMLCVGLVEPATGNIWDRAEYSSLMIAFATYGGQNIGFKLDPVVGDQYSADISFFSGGRLSSNAYGSAGSPWSSLSTFKWFVKKTSAGKPGETLPLVRAEVFNTSAGTGSAYIQFSTKLDDTHSCFSTASGVFTPAFSGLLQVHGNLLNGTTAACTAYIVVKRGGPTIQTKIIGRTDVASSRIMCHGSVRVQAGDEVAIFCDQATAASSSADMTFEMIGR